MADSEITGVTVQVHVNDIEAGVKWYGSLLGRPPDVEPHEDFKEWELVPSAWLQLAEGDASQTRAPIRLGVTDIEHERERVVSDLAVDVSEIERIEGLAAWCNFQDPWGNRLGLFEDLALNANPCEPGGRVSDFS